MKECRIIESPYLENRRSMELYMLSTFKEVLR